ncbi:tyrosine-type recombinase/integrase [Beijerinckia mobilis]|uniref:tyrosine-type recombinase/integrase n=1 Tax=Beijerinckia mobilis TaxID=231434 RepID=UPI00068D28DB|nr:tyrosine-type recombinase/integrase [Beijerinckia mobilis]
MADEDPDPLHACLSPKDRRALALDSLRIILPPARREQMAELLSEDEIATLKHLAREGTPDNTLRALASDLAYLEAWAQAATGTPLPWPASEALLLRFLAHHLWDPVKRAEDPGHGMPEAIATALRAQDLLRSAGPHSPATVERRLASWTTLHRRHGVIGPFQEPRFREALRLAVRAAKRPRHRKSTKPVTRDILDLLLATCSGDKLADVRDRALLHVAFAAGGRLRSEVARLRVEDLVERPPVPADPAHPKGAVLPCLAWRLGTTKNTTHEQDVSVLMIGQPVEALRLWCAAAQIDEGPIFRAIDRFERVGMRPLSGNSVNEILKARCRAAGLDPKDFSAHGLRSGYLTEAARRGIPIQEAMRQSGHSSIQQAAAYYNEVEMEKGQATRMG